MDSTRGTEPEVPRTCPSSAVDRYHTVVDLDDFDSSHTIGVACTPPGTSVLDVGCADGSVAAVLRDRGCSVVGLDVDRDAIDTCPDAGLEAFEVDLEQPGALGVVDGRQFDVILCLDVLEHLRDPGPLLRDLGTLLVPDGRVVISIPNIAHGAVRLALLEGRFEYREAGLLDETHLRFFTRASAESLVTDAGLTIRHVFTTDRPIDGTEIAVDVSQVPTDVRTGLDEDPQATVYQFVIVAGRGPAAHSIGEAEIVAAHARRDARRVEAVLEATRAETSELRDRLEHTRTQAELELAQTLDELAQAHGELAQTQGARQRAELERDGAAAGRVADREADRERAEQERGRLDDALAAIAGQHADVERAVAIAPLVEKLCLEIEPALAALHALRDEVASASELTRQLASARAELEGLRRSPTWRLGRVMAAPARFVKRRFSS